MSNSKQLLTERYALLQAAATILTGDTEKSPSYAVDLAYALLNEIDERQGQLLELAEKLKEKKKHREEEQKRIRAAVQPSE